MVRSPSQDVFSLVERYLDGLSQERMDGPVDRNAIRKAVSRLINLSSYPFTALQLSADLSLEEVANIFVRINSAGTTLNQSDFILTLMSVFHESQRRELEQFCREARRTRTICCGSRLRSPCAGRGSRRSTPFSTAATSRTASRSTSTPRAEADEERRKLAQAAALYFLLEEDAEHDLAPGGGFQDDELVLAAVELALSQP